MICEPVATDKSRYFVRTEFKKGLYIIECSAKRAAIVYKIGIIAHAPSVIYSLAMFLTNAHVVREAEVILRTFSRGKSVLLLNCLLDA